MNRRAFTAISLALGLGLAAPAWSEDKPVIDQIKETKVLRVGLGTFVPWAFVNKDGALVGFEVDVATRLAADLGVELELVPTAWDAIIPSLVAGQFDVVIGGLTITEERAQTVDFTKPYEHSQTYVVVNANVAPEITTLEQVNAAGVTISARRGSSANPQAFFPQATALLFDDENMQIQEFFNGNAKAIFTSTPTPALLVERDPALARILEPAVSQSDEAFALRKGDPASQAAFNDWIDARWADGFLTERYDYWFKGRDWAAQVAPE
ncbi:transporter substrate-binding domain-containing protein [Rhodobacter ferrooxidans]|uniref:Extracellular solute-binding protein family 3 n=1 Tax=Rhodobacter ferrooxidans TaxID=371731 RepID=C8RZY6_9RHOB|nr:transporter substrate-binding domain-containing protein [Rhodobacter sp. SW2]EEW25595.1 extracellular solute-binding protein family 3 [Rhodobacter sp. SW2]